MSRKLKIHGKDALSEDEDKDALLREVRLWEYRKNSIRSDLSSIKLLRKSNPKRIDDGDPEAPWYFTHT